MVLTIKHRGFQRILSAQSVQDGLAPGSPGRGLSLKIQQILRICSSIFRRSGALGLGMCMCLKWWFTTIHYHENHLGESLFVFGCGFTRYWSLKLESLGSPIQHLYTCFPMQFHTFNLQFLQKQQQPPYSMGYFRSYRILLEICMLAYLAFPHFWTSP